MGAGIDPLWRAAPRVLLRFRGLLVGQIVASALLVLAVVSGPMFLSATGNAALNSSIASTDRFTSGLSVSISNELPRPEHGRPLGFDYKAADRRLDRATSGLDHLAPRVSTIITGSAVAQASGSTATYPIRLISRTDAAAHVQQETGSSNDPRGLLIPDIVANELKVGIGDDLTLTSQQRTVRVPIAGIYKSLINTVLAPFWRPLEQQINPLSPLYDPPPPFLIGTRSFVVSLAHTLRRNSAMFQWDYPLATRTGLDLADATVLSRALARLEGELSDRSTSLGRYFSCQDCNHYGFPYGFPNVAVGLQTPIDAAHAQVDSLREPVTAVTGAAALVALVTIGAVGAYASTRRGVELRLLIVRGWSAVAVAAKSAVESLLPCVFGAAVGYGAALGLVVALGPGGSISVRPYELAAATIPAALVVGFVTTAVIVARMTLTTSASRRTRTFIWEVVPLVLGIALYRWSASESARFTAAGSTVRDVTLLLGVPVLLVAGVAGAAARLFRGALTAAGRFAGRAGPSIYLALRRLASSGNVLTGMLVGSVLAVGIASYGSSMASSMRETTEAKASVFTGGDVSVTAQPGYEPPASFPYPTTQGYQFSDGGTVGPSHTPVGLLAVDPSTLARGIRWYPSFSSDSLDDIVAGLKRPIASGLPVVAVGDLGGVTTLDLSGASMPTRVVAHASAFPGTFGSKPWIVVDRDSLTAASLASAGTDPVGNLQSDTPMWVRGDPDKVLGALERIGFVPADILTTRQVLEQPAYLAATRTFRILQTIGLAAALLAAVAILLYVQARQRSRAVVAALSSRMGLGRLAQMAATFAELFAMLLCAIFFGFVIGAFVAVLIHGHADPLPDLLPPPLLHISAAELIPMIGAGLLLAAAGAGAAQLVAERANFAEAMRHAE